MSAATRAARLRAWRLKRARIERLMRRAEERWYIEPALPVKPVA